MITSNGNGTDFLWNATSMIISINKLTLYINVYFKLYLAQLQAFIYRKYYCLTIIITLSCCT